MSSILVVSQIIKMADLNVKKKQAVEWPQPSCHVLPCVAPCTKSKQIPHMFLGFVAFRPFVDISLRLVSQQHLRRRAAARPTQAVNHPRFRALMVEILYKWRADLMGRIL